MRRKHRFATLPTWPERLIVKFGSHHWFRGNLVTKPQIRYAKSGKISTAYRMPGSGPLDLVFAPGWITHLELIWAQPAYARFLRG
jgi:hypothetical protein